MTFNREHNFQDKIIQNILGIEPDQNQELSTDNETNEQNNENRTEDIDFNALAFERKINQYQQYQDILSKDYHLGLSLLANKKENESFVDFMEKWRKEGKVDFFSDLEPFLSNIPESNGSRIFNKIDKRVGIICDEFLYNSYKDVVNLEYIPYNYESMNLNF